MQKLKKYALYGIPILIGGYLIYRQLRKPKTSNTIVQPPENIPSNTGGSSGSTSGSTSVAKCTFPISKNFNVCQDIKDVQFYLNNILSYTEILEVQKWYSKKDDWAYFTSSDGIKIGCTNTCDKKPLVMDGKLGDKTIALWNDTMMDNPKTSFTKSDIDELKSFYLKMYGIQQAIDFPLVSTPSPLNPLPFSENYLARNSSFGI
jgi:hypothetical protein